MKKKFGNEEHNFTSTVTKEPTCSETGIRTYTCECGFSKIEIIDKINHKYGEFVSDDTYHWKVCLDCNEETTHEKHTFGDWKVTTEPTCSTPGIKERKCTVCGFSEYGTVNQINHQHTVYVYNENAHYKYCTDCCQKPRQSQTFLLF